MSSEDPFTQGDALTVTLKYGKDYADPWLVIRGSSAEDTKRRVAEAVGIEGWEEYTLVELIVSAKRLVLSANNVATQLGGTVLPRSAGAAEEQAPAAQATAKPEEPTGPTLAERIEGVASKKEGQQLYLNNRAAIDGDPEGLKAKMMAKMKSL